jgi:hypothetical protein
MLLLMMKKLRYRAMEKRINPIPVELPIPSTDLIKTCPGMSSVEAFPINATSEIAASASEDEDNPTNPPKRSWVKLNHPPQQLLESIEEGRRLRNRVIQSTSEVANQVSYSCYLTQAEPKKVDEALQDESWVAAMHDASGINRILQGPRLVPKKVRGVTRTS